MDVLDQSLVVNRVRAAIGEGKLHLYQHNPKQNRDVIYIEFCTDIIPYGLCEFFSNVNHKPDQPQRGDRKGQAHTRSHQDLLTYIYVYVLKCGSCSFFSIVLNLVDNREGVSWVGLWPGLIGKPMDELENLTGSHFFIILIHNHAENSL